MMICTVKFDKKKLVMAVVLAALFLVGVILLVGAIQKASALRELEDAGDRPVSVRSERNGADYLSSLGWEVETPAVSHGTVVIPRTFTSVLEDYNELQKQQGFDLSRYCGSEVEMYTFRVSNSSEPGEVLAVLYVCDGAVIGGDVHSTALDGFMVGIRQ